MKVLLFTNARQLGARRRRGARRAARRPAGAGAAAGRRRGERVRDARASRTRRSRDAPGSFAQSRRGVDRLLERQCAGAREVRPAAAEPRRDGGVRGLGGERPSAMTQPVTLRDGLRPAAAPRRSRQGRAHRAAASAAGGGRPRARPGEARRGARRCGTFAARLLGPPGDALFACGAACGAGRSVSVDAYGRAQPCSYVRAPELTVDLIGREGRARHPRRGRRALRRARRPARHRPGVPAALRALLPQGALRAVPGQVVDRARHARTPRSTTSAMSRTPRRDSSAGCMGTKRAGIVRTGGIG